MTKKRILLIDDSEVALAVAGDALQKNGYEVLTATNGLEANHYLFQRQQPDLILIDVMIPLLNGNRTAKLIKENENTRQIPILLLSSKPEEELRRLAAESGSDGFVQKPFDARLLVEQIEETLRLREGGRG
jgi:DNA-binding response OmpR family regulator